MAAAPLALALVAALSPLVVRPLAAQAPEDLQRIGQRLSALGPLEPLPDSPRNRDAGDIAVIEHDGSSYDRRRGDGTPNYEARARVGLRFYETHADDYDFLVVFTNFEFDTGTALAFHTVARNDVQGIGKPVGSVEAAPFGSRSRLKGWIDMAAVSRYQRSPYALAPGGPDFLRTLGVLAHELGHQWLAEARYKVGDVVFDDLLGADDTHWSYLLDSDGSFLYGADWRSRGDGTWAAASVRERYSPLDLYLMGLLPRDKVPPLTLLRNPAVDRRRVNLEDETVGAADTTTVTIEQVIAALGPRVPDSLHAQKEFRVGFVFLAAPGTEPSPEDLDGVERVRRAFGAHFFSLTNGVGWADTRLATASEAPRAEAPDLDRALAWLAARQGLDGSWADSPETRVRDTAAAVLALSRARHAPLPRQRGAGFLRAAGPESLDFQARVAAALDPGLLSVAERQAQAARILGAQNPDGGWGAAADFATDALDTALALRALAALEQPLDGRIVRAVEALGRLAGPDGGWAAVSGGDTSTVVTAEVLLALHDWSAASQAVALRAQGLAALLARRNADGGFGSSPSTPHASALALEVLLRAGAGAELVDPLSEWLQRAQLSDGSWASSSYQTALVLSALSQSLGANLVVPADSVALSANPAREGDPVRVVARVRNAGRAAAPATVARLFDADPASAPALAEAPVPALAPGAEAELALDYPTVDRPGRRTLYVVADADARVRESREDDNTASASLSVEGLLADLTLAASDITLSPAVPEVGEPALLTVTVHNQGERDSPACTVAFGITDSAGRSLSPAAAALPPLAPGEAGTVSIPWQPAAADTYRIRVLADAAFEVPESDETNGVAERAARVLVRSPDGAALALVAPRIEPSALRELPQEITLTVGVENAGRTPATTSVAVRDPLAGGSTIGSASLTVEARSAARVSLTASVVGPGERLLELVVDPDDTIPEEDESDNRAAVALADEHTFELQLVTAVLSASEVEVGHPVLLTAEIRNRGTLDVPSIPVSLGREAGAGVAELARGEVSLPAGQSVLITLPWTPSAAADELPLVVRVDPFDLLRERRENDNALSLRLRVLESGLPNLAIDGAELAFAPDPPVEGQPAVVSAVVHNRGTSAAGAFAVRFYAGDPEQGGSLLGETAIAGLEAGEQRTLMLDVASLRLRGTIGLFVVVDGDDAVEESLESDNRAFRPFSVLGLPDLVLAAADVVLEPGYPRAGEAVTIRATIRNLGGQPSAAVTLDVGEGELGAATPVGTLVVPEIMPGAAAELSLSWTPLAPPGARTLTLVVDPGGLVVEQDEGNNSVRRTVVVQNADLYLTEPYFSPNGDGVKDETALAWRASGGVRVEVRDASGQSLRTLVADGPAAASVVWDGRDERGVLARDGRYSVSLVDAGGATLGRLAVVLDTNRGTLHEVTPDQTLVRNLTCALPESAVGPAWLPGEQEALFLVRDASAGFEPGLLRVGLDGSYEYLHRDPAYASADLPSDSAVSPDGRHVLIRLAGSLVRVDLTTGERLPIAGDPFSASWSPDSRFITTAGRVLTRDGELVADVSSLSYSWAWSPSSDRLAAGPVVVARDGTELARFPIDEESWRWQSTQWLGDGRVFTIVNRCDDSGAPECFERYLLDPQSGEFERLAWGDDNEMSWSADGTRVLTRDGLLRDAASGAALWPLLPGGAWVSPAASAASFWRSIFDAERPGRVCGDKQGDTFAVASLANLTADLQVVRLAANNGLLIRGTVADANLERFELDFARQGEAPAWHPIGPAYDVPIVDDDITPWVPPGPGTYVLRLRVHDRAGNTLTRTRVVAWDRVPALANFTQTEYFVSPDGNGVKDEVRFGFLVVEPTTLVVRVKGPEPEQDGGPAPVERRIDRLELASLGPAAYVWNGHDAAGQVVPDGRYTVLLNDLPFRVEVDSRPPDIAMRFERLHVAPASFDGPVCTTFPHEKGGVTLGSIAADRLWHAIDPNLKGWAFSAGADLLEMGNRQIHDVERDAEGRVAVDPGGALRIRRVGGRPADRVEQELGVPWLAAREGLVFTAEDHAGNRSALPVPPLPEGVVPLGASYRCTPTLVPPVASDDQPGPREEPVVHPLAPGQLVLVAGTSLHRELEDQNVRLSFEPREGGTGGEAPLTEHEDGSWYLPVPRFEDLGIDPIRTYRGRFLGQGGTGEVASDDFLFRPCREWLSVEFVPGALPPPFMVLRSETTEPIEEAWAIVRERDGSTSRLDLHPAGDGVFAGRILPLCQAPTYSIHAITSSGRKLPDEPMRESSCLRLAHWMTPPTCGSLKLEQQLPYCAGSPDQLHLVVSGAADDGSRVDVEEIGRAGPPLASFVVAKSPFEERLVIDVHGVREGVMRLRARLTKPDAGPDDEPIEALLDAIVDRTPAVADVLLPPDNGLACLVPSAEADALTLRVVARDVSPKLEIEGATLRPPGGPLTALRRVCAGPGCDEPFVDRGQPSDLTWDARGLPGGDHELRLSFCDRAGNRTTAERRLTLTRPVAPRLVTVTPSPFSPNDDGRADSVTAVFRLAEAARLTATVRQGSAEGPHVRALLADAFQLASDVSVTWDGRRDDGLVATDGVYVIVLSVENGCAGVAEARASVELDRTPPEVGIVNPTPGQRVRATVDVSGHVTDERLAHWRLEVACGSGEPTLVMTNRNRIEPEGVISPWDTSRSPAGACTLRLAAEDRAQNRAEVSSPVEVASGGFVRQLVATPDLLSPNGDGRRETTTIRFELARPARTRVEIRRTDGSLVRALAAESVLDAGGYDLGWDGRDASLAQVADDAYVAWLRAEAPDDAASHEEQTARVVVDATPPALAVSRPSEGAYVAADARVQGTIADVHLLEYVLVVTPAGGGPSELARDSRPRSDAPLASLWSLSDGPHSLTLSAEDLAENRAALTVPFQVDSGPPSVEIASPSDEAVLRRGEQPVAVSGGVEDANLQGWSLRFGAGEAPLGFGTIAEGASTGTLLPLGSWDVRALPDGLYTLSLVASDRGSLRSEARVSVTLDGTPPQVSIASPAEGSYVTGPGPILGSVSDASLEGWLLEAAPGAPAGAYQWEPVAAGRSAVEDGALATWSPLPPDGPYTLRLSASDRVGLKASVSLGVVVDTTPPAVPTGLAARVTRVSDMHGRVVVTWNPNTESDLAGYLVRRGEEDLHSGIHASPEWDDGERLEGPYAYSVVAVDRAGNRSAPAALPVRVDVTPPAVSFASPGEDAAVSGAVEVRGTAYSADDFAEYRLLVGAGEAPTAWTLLRRSTVAVAAARLGEWLALVDGSYVLALEAEDTAGNAARATRRVRVDTDPPGAPVLTAVAHDAARPDTLRPEWQPGPASDVVGHLVYRDGRIANAASLVLGDLAAYAVAGVAYEDHGLPDGRHCYRVVALDGAGNSSTPSNEICQSIDNRPPSARILQPADASRFGQPVRIVAATSDRDVAEIRFELRAVGAGDWIAFGTVPSAEGQPIPPWEVTLDPFALALAPGEYELRAVATDRGSRTDPDPEAITVEYGDTTPPASPIGLVARVDGADVGLSWTASDAPDFASYSVYRDGVRLAEGVAEPRLLDPGLAPGSYDYQVTAVDADGNESSPSAPAPALVYALSLDEPDWPVTTRSVVTLTGAGARPPTTLRVDRAGASVAEAPAADDSFRIEDVPLVPEGNLLSVRGEDAEGNRSIRSNEIVVISNDPPGAVTDLTANVAGRSVTLSFTPVAAPDLAGYLVWRDGAALTRTVPQTEAGSLEATGGFGDPAAAFDGDPRTAWPALEPAIGEWTVRFAAPVLVAHVRVRFAETPAARYSLRADWQGRFVTLARVRGNREAVIEHRLPSAFATGALRIVLEAPGRLAELSVDRIDALSPSAIETRDTNVPDGRHRYEVAAVDRYGASGPAARVDAGVGDVEPPGAPTGLVATPEGRDVRLAWDPSPEPDVVRYAVLRGGVRIGSADTPAYRDPGLVPGTYTYTVIAVDRSGLESPESAPASATIAASSAPARPVILEPTDAAHPITLAASRADVAGRSDGGTTVEVEVNGEPRGSAPTRPGFERVRRIERPAGHSSVLAPDGERLAWLDGLGAIVVRDLTGAEQRFDAGGSPSPGVLSFSADGGRLAFTRFSPASGWQLAVLDLADGAVRPLIDGMPGAFAWSPDASRVAVAPEAGGATLLQVVDLASGTVRELERGSGSDRWLRWSPDGARLAFVRRWHGDAAELRLVELDSGRAQVLDGQPWPEASPAWSPDGSRVVWTSVSAAGLRLRFHDVARDEPAGELAEASADAARARFSPDGGWLSYVRIQRSPEGVETRSVVARQLATGLSTTVGAPRGSWSWPEDHEWLGGRLSLGDGASFDLYAPESGRFLVPQAALEPGDNLIVARATDPASRLTSPDSEAVLVTTTRSVFPDLAVEAGSLLLAPGVAPVGRSVQVRARVDGVGSAPSPAAALALRVVDATGSVVFEALEPVPPLEPGTSAWLSAAWTPAFSGRYTVRVAADDADEVAESDESNNAAEQTLLVVDGMGVTARIDSDRDSYPAAGQAVVTVGVANTGLPFVGVARTTVEELDGREVAVLDQRSVSLEWGRSVSFTTAWATGSTLAGRYAFRVRMTAAGAATPAAAAEKAFEIEPGLSLLARVRPQPVQATLGAPVSFALTVDNRSANTPLEGASARLRVLPEGTSGPATFETVRALPRLLPAGGFEAVDLWPSARAAGRFAVRFEVEKGGVALASASATLTVTAPGAQVAGALGLVPGDVLAGGTVEARLTLRNVGAAGVTGYPIAVEVVSGPQATVLASIPDVVDLGAGETRTLTVPIATTDIAPGHHIARLRGGSPLATLDTDRLVVHGAIVPPSPHAPAEGARVATSHPTLVVNDAVSPEGAALRYEFEVYGDAALTQPLPGARDVAQAPPRTPWTVAARLAEDTRYYWRARAGDGFSQSAWSAVASFTVDELDLPPTAPVPDTPLPGARVASRQPPLGVKNALDPEGEPLAYEFRLARDQAMADVVAAQAGLAEGLGFTTWLPPLVLDEDATYYWSARARTPGDGPQAFSPWSDPVSFRVDTVNESPTPPRPLRPTGGARVATPLPELVVENATDPEGDPLVYRFELDSRPSLDSPDRQASGEVLEGTGETGWRPARELLENTTYYWRAFAGDGATETASILATFFVNAANEPPTAPVPLDPVDGRAVGTPTPTLCARNSVDPEADPLSYVFEVRDAGGAVAWSSDAVASGPAETCAVSAPLAENASFTWSARASDGELFSPWSPPAAFRVDAVAEAPTAPEPLAPADGATLDERPTLVVRNATSPDSLPLVYTFELERLADDGTPTLVERAEGVVETPDTTAWTPDTDLDDGSYQWRARASDPRLDGPWSVTFRFTLTRDRAPAAPTGLVARAGDARVSLTWSTSLEPDVAAYGVYRSETPGGPYAPVAVVPAPAHEDAGLVNGVTYYYVVTARDARAESGYSNEAAARPSAPTAIVAEAMFDPPRIPAECLLAGRDHDHDDEDDDDDHDGRDDDDRDGDRDDRRDGHDGYRGKRDDSRHKRDAGDSKRGHGRRQGSCRPPDGCPEWLYAAIEPPAGVSAASIEPGSLRLFGSARPDYRYATLTDVDHDGRAELRVRFALEDVARHLVIGLQTLTIVGRAGASALTATGRLEVLPVSATLRMEPRTLKKRSHGEDVVAKVNFAAGVEADDVDVASIRLNGVVVVERVLSRSGRELKLKFDRAAVVAVLPTGSSVEVRLSGLLRGLPFVGIDHIRVIQ